jgi:hypothetical protein
MRLGQHHKKINYKKLQNLISNKLILKKENKI